MLGIVGTRSPLKRLHILKKCHMSLHLTIIFGSFAHEKGRLSGLMSLIEFIRRFGFKNG